MSQPVKLSDALVLDARLAAELQERSIAGQVEYWAKLGQAIDHLLTGPQVQALRRAGRKESLAERIASVDTPEGRERLEAYLETRPFPHYKEGGSRGLLLRIDEDGTETLGRFVNRVFVPAEAVAPGKPSDAAGVERTEALARR
jgi:ParD-like antitoxin of type II ParDE toxin-antitoxin system